MLSVRDPKLTAPVLPNINPIIAYPLQDQQVSHSSALAAAAEAYRKANVTAFRALHLPRLAPRFSHQHCSIQSEGTHFSINVYNALSAALSASNVASHSLESATRRTITALSADFSTHFTASAKRQHDAAASPATHSTPSPTPYPQTEHTPSTFAQSPEPDHLHFTANLSLGNADRSSRDSPTHNLNAQETSQGALALSPRLLLYAAPSRLSVGT